MVHAAPSETYAENQAFDAKMDGIVEADETYVAGKERTNINPRTLDTQGRCAKVKAPVFGMVQRGGRVNGEVKASK